MVSTDKISPNKSQEIFVDKCDHGDFIFNVNTNGPPDWSNRWSKYTIWLEFHSSVVLDASPPTCNIYTNGSFILPPPQQPSQSASQYEVMPPLPSCFTADSREGYHMTYYWFFLYEWPGMPHSH